MEFVYSLLLITLFSGSLGLHLAPRITPCPIERFANFTKCLIADNGVPAANLVSDSNSPEYTRLNHQWNTRGEQKMPLAFLIPDNAQEIREAVKCGKAAQIRLVPKSGGHGYTKLAFGDSGSIVVDLRKLNSVQVIASQRVGVVGAGVNIGTAAYEFWENGRFLTPLGICPTVGVSGVALGGGHGIYSRLYGLATDNIIEMEMVDADGELRTVNNLTNSDLFWALRGAGGSGSFGIVTKFVLKLHPIPHAVVFGLISFEFCDFSRVLSVYQSLWFGSNANLSKYKYFTALFIIRYERISIRFYHIQMEADQGIHEMESVLALFPSPLSTSIEKTSYIDFLVAESLRGGYNDYIKPNINVTQPSDLTRLTYEGFVYMKAKSLYIAKELSPHDLNAMQHLLARMQFPHSFIFLETYGGAINDLSNDDTAFVHRGATRFQLAMYYRAPEANQTELAEYDYVFEASKPILGHVESYQNYLDDELETPLERYYGTNLERLVRVKKDVDPENYFNGPLSINAQ